MAWHSNIFQIFPSVHTRKCQAAEHRYIFQVRMSEITAPRSISSRFRPGISSYIQLWKEQQLTLRQLERLKLGQDPPVELLVLSACRTAFGDLESELGFAGLAVLAGVKSALGSLWYVSDEGTLALMTTFYDQLRRTPVKAEALRQAQLAMLRGEVRLENGQLITPNEQFPLNPTLARRGNRDLSHPFFWSAFTIVGNPW